MVGKPTIRFDAPGLLGPSPAVGRVVERVASHGRHLEIVWDDGIVLHTHLRKNGAWHLYRDGELWRRSVTEMRVEVRTADWVGVCFSAPVVETYRQFDRSRHPGFGSFGPDLSEPDADLDESANRLYHHPDQDAFVAEVLLDEHIARGLGNVYRCELLWSTQVHPFATVSSLDGDDCAMIIEAAAQLVRSNIRREPTRIGPPPLTHLQVYGRNGQQCSRCGDTVEVCRSGEHGRLLYWCSGCQLHRAPAHHSDDLDETREMDPHPAAARYLHDLPWRRHEAG